MAANAMSLAGGTGAPARPRGRADAGLSIVVPVYNEAGNLPALHARIAEVAKRPARTTRRLAAEVVYVDDGSRDATLAVAHEPAGRRARRPGGLAVAQFRQGGGAARRPRSRPPRRRAVHGRRRPASADAGRHAGRPLARRRLRRRLHRQGPPRERALAAPALGAGLLRHHQLGRAPEDPGGRRRLPPAVAARRRGAAATARAQPLLQGTGELDRLPPDPGRLRAGGARARPQHLELLLAGRACRSRG